MSSSGSELVSLISFTQSVSHSVKDGEILSTKNLTDQICYVARVSNPAKQDTDDFASNEKLINYLLRNKHFSPFEMVNICLEINTTRDISRQILRHRSFSFQEFSQRYADPTKHLTFQNREARLQDKKNRQNSIELTEEKADIADEFTLMQNELIEHSKQLYEKAISKGIAKEQARVLLPEGLMGTRIYMNGSVRSWIHYISVRTDPTTQKEHREIATQCAHVISTIFPQIMDFVHH